MIGRDMDPFQQNHRVRRSIRRELSEVTGTNDSHLSRNSSSSKPSKRKRYTPNYLVP